MADDDTAWQRDFAARMQAAQARVPTNLADFPHIRITDRQHLPALCAVYFVVKRPGTILYVGVTQSLRPRWRYHHKWDVLHEAGATHIAWLPQDDIQIALAIERHCIQRLRPPFNSLKKTSGFRKKRGSKESHEGDVTIDTPRVSFDPKALQRSIGEKVMVMRKHKHLSQIALATMTDISDNTIVRLEHGASVISAGRLYAIAQALDVPMGYFFGEVTV